MIDVHAHFAEEGYEFPAEWERILSAGVRRVILASDTMAHARIHREFARRYEGCYFTVGIHPSELGEPYDDFSELASDKKCVAVGEIGLDYHYPDADRAAQRLAFAEQIELAGRFALPLQIHSRDALSDTLAVLRENRAALKSGFLMHCYSYGREELEHFSELGAYFSFGGVSCFKNARRVAESVEKCPLERILSETDSPYLSPFRGEKNTPANIPVIVRRIAELKGVPFEEAEAAIEQNAERLFQKLI